VPDSVALLLYDSLKQNISDILWLQFISNRETDVKKKTSNEDEI